MPIIHYLDNMNLCSQCLTTGQALGAGSPVTYLLVAPGIEPARIAHAAACLLATAVYLERRARHAEIGFLMTKQAQW